MSDVELTSFKSGQELDNDLYALGFNLSSNHPSIDPPVEETLVAASIDAVVNDNSRIAGLLVDWISIHSERIHVERLYKILSGLADESFPFVKVFWAGNAKRLEASDWRFKKIVSLHSGKRLDYIDRLSKPGVPRMTDSYVKMNGEDDRFKGTCLRVPVNAFSHRPHQIAPAQEIAHVHMGFRYRIMMGVNYRADIWALLRRNPSLSGYRLSKIARCSAPAATKIRNDYLLVKRDYSNRKSA